MWGIRVQSDGNGRALSFWRTRCFREMPVFLAQSQSHQRPESWHARITTEGGAPGPLRTLPWLGV